MKTECEIHCVSSYTFSCLIWIPGKLSCYFYCFCAVYVACRVVWKHLVCKTPIWKISWRVCCGLRHFSSLTLHIIIYATHLRHPALMSYNILLVVSGWRYVTSSFVWLRVVWPKRTTFIYRNVPIRSARPNRSATKWVCILWRNSSAPQIRSAGRL